MNIREFIEDKKKKREYEQLTADKYIQLFEKNDKELETLMTYYECALMEIETKFKVMNAQFELTREYSPIETIKSRLKTIDSLVAKSHLYNVKPTFQDIEDKIEDVAGIRVICSFPEDIYIVADCFLQQDDITLIDCKDYIKNPKPNGYRSLHLIVSVPIFLEHEKRDMKVEVQLRTISMDFWASLEHKLKYKKELPADINDRIVEELLECATTSAELDMRMQNVRRQITGGVAHIDDEVDLQQWM